MGQDSSLFGHMTGGRDLAKIEDLSNVDLTCKIFRFAYTSTSTKAKSL